LIPIEHSRREAGFSAAKRFFKMMRAEHRRLPFSNSIDKNAAYPEAFSTSQAERIVPKDCKAAACEVPEQCD
jgi:hypothetical protein